MFSALFSLLLCLQLVAADTIPRIQHANSAVTPHVIRELLAHNVKRDNSDGCPSGYSVCSNFPGTCAQDGSYCCSDLLTCPNSDNCFDDACCPKDAQTCGGKTCCESGTNCCSDNISCCDTLSTCCNDSFGGCCPLGSSCIINTPNCTYYVSVSLDPLTLSVPTGGLIPTSSPLLLPSTFDLSPTLSPGPGSTLNLPTANGPTHTVTATPSSSSSSTRASTSTATTIPTSGVSSTGGAPHNVSMMSIGWVTGLALAASIVALGNYVL